MKLKGIEFSILQVTSLLLYYGIARHLPYSDNMLLGGVSRKIRARLCKNIFKFCGNNVNVEHGACFGSGRLVELGDNSGLGINCMVPSDIMIGKDVMMGPNCYILSQNHKFSDLSVPMNRQGFVKKGRTVIEDDVWIGRDVTLTPGRHIAKGTIIGACCLLCKDFPEYSIVGGNPSKLIKSRLDSK